MAASNGFHASWADQVPIAVPCVPYTGPPLDGCDSDMAQQNGLSPRMLFLAEQPTPQEMGDIMSATKHGVLVSGSAASGIIGPLMGSYDLSESDDGFLFRFALPGAEKNEKFKCEVQADGTILIQGVTNTGEKQVHSNNMVFEMRSQNLCPPGDFALQFRLPTNVDPSTLKFVLDSGVLEGVVKKKPVQGS
ncbi:alpha-crystallin domain-containing protein 22.3-like [Bidens hawaiensis]|uniref:alpha-crystallin domain-containing protein 22.3-like n=1 Tax=Bidens hawaiensis TaxID=980011 RepID=UPI00404B4847